jgi:serine/threonine protein kinase
MGEVYLAAQKGSHELAAIKVPKPEVLESEDLRRQFFLEAQALLELVSHNNIVKVKTVYKEGRPPFIAMEYLGGSTLAEGIKKNGTYTQEETVRIIRPLASALDHVHEKHLVHRDVKPSNIRFRTGDEPVLLDFGIVQMDDRTVLPGAATLLYRSPEQINSLEYGSGAAQDRITGASDQYQLAIIAFEMLTGRVPDHLRSDPPPPDSWNSALKEVFRIALDKEPARRFPSCVAFADALEDAGIGRTPRRPVLGEVPRQPPSSRKPALRAADAQSTTTVPKGVLFGSLGAVVLVWVVVLSWVFVHIRHPRPPVASPGAGSTISSPAGPVAPGLVEPPVLQPPDIQSISPSEVVAGPAPHRFTLGGRAFREGMQVAVWLPGQGPILVTPRIVSDSQLYVVLDVDQTGTYRVGVRGSSRDPWSQSSFTVKLNIPSAVIDSIDPSDVPAGPAPREFTVGGNGFREGMQVAVWRPGRGPDTVTPRLVSDSVLRLSLSIDQTGEYKLGVRGSPTDAWVQRSFRVTAALPPPPPPARVSPLVSNNCPIRDVNGQRASVDPTGDCKMKDVVRGSSSEVFVHVYRFHTTEKRSVTLSATSQQFTPVLLFLDEAANRLQRNDPTTPGVLPLVLDPGDHVVLVTATGRTGGQYVLNMQ